MRYYILNHEIKQSRQGGDYYHVNICNEDLEQFHTYIYPTQSNGKKIHNAQDWVDILHAPQGVVVSGLKHLAKDNEIINADSIRKADLEEVFNTKQDMYDHIADLIQKADYNNNDNDLWEF